MNGVLPPSCFICARCGARFEGDLREASDSAFRHSAEHAEPVGKTPMPEGAQAIDSERRQARLALSDNHQFFERSVNR